MVFDDLDFISTPEKWPLNPMLPVKRQTEQGSFPDCAVLVSKGDGTYILVHTSIFELNPNASTEQFESAHDVTKAGWVVD